MVVDGIPDLQLDHEPAPPVSTWTTTIEDASSQDNKKLLFSFPEGALIVIDEAQRVYRPRPVGSKVPPEVAAFETHRHQGLDFLILTQHPNLIDANVRKLVGRHLHIRDLGVLGRKVYEWPEVGNPERFRDAPIQRKYTMRRKSFALYKSASLHVKPKRGIPKGLLAVALAIPLLIAGSVIAWQSINKKIENKPVVITSNHAAALPATPSPAAQSVDRDEMLVQFVPRISGRPETAPGYDGLRQVVNMPVVAGCIQTSTRCRCQTQTGTDAGLDRSQCLAWLENPPFDPYREIVKPEPSRVADEARPAATGGKVQDSPEALPMGESGPKSAQGGNSRAPIT